MRLGIRDAVAALIVAAILAPYAGLLVRGRMPYVEDVRTMAAVSLAGGVLALAIADRFSVHTLIGRAEAGFATGAAVLSGLAIAYASTAFGQLLLVAQVTAIVLTWAIQLLDHAGYRDGPTVHDDSTAPTPSHGTNGRPRSRP